MPHQCLRCNKIYDNTANEIIKGCSCGNRSFLFMKKLPEKETEIEISTEKRKKILKEIEFQSDKFDIDTPIIIEVGSVDVISPGKYRIDINKLMKREEERVPIYKIGDGTFFIDIEYLN
jgi:predicted  nucleic acid-binding Zn-ribbon protein